LNEKKGHEYATDHGSGGFKDIDLSNGRSIFFDILRIEFRPVSKKGSMRKSHGKQDQEGGVKYWGKTESFSWCREKNIFEYPGKIDSRREGYRKDKLEQNIDLYFLFCLFNCFANEKGTHCLKDQPVGEDNAESEFVAGKGDEELSQQDDLCNDSADSHDEQRNL
jgi:hypothetical protein